MPTDDWIKTYIAAFVHRTEVPKMTAIQERVFKQRLAEILANYLPTSNEWIECVDLALERTGMKSKEKETP